MDSTSAILTLTANTAYGSAQASIARTGVGDGRAGGGDGEERLMAMCAAVWPEGGQLQLQCW